LKKIRAGKGGGGRLSENNFKAWCGERKKKEKEKKNPWNNYA
jgi:hypothetical protein